MTVKALQASFTAWGEARQALVLASVYETEGSTYSKAGARMLIAGDGRFQGMLSGGCLEGDLALRANAVLASGKPQKVTYDLGRSDDELWGLGVGCDGLMRIFLQPLSDAPVYQPFAAMAKILAGERPGVALTVLESERPTIAPGATVVTAGGHAETFGIPEDNRDALCDACGAAMGERRSSTRILDVGGAALEVLIARLLPPPRLLVLGAGLDAEPLLCFADELGWRVTLQDHRPAYVAQGRFASAEEVLCEPAEALSARLARTRYDAVIVMSHHLATDRSYLRQLAATDIPYVGLLGPRNRRDRLLADLGTAAGDLEARLHGPAGLDLGADEPASIALSILAEMLTAVNDR